MDIPSSLGQTGQMPLSPDFAEPPEGPAITSLRADPDWLSITWADGITGRFFRNYLFENTVGDEAINPATRERDLDPDQIPEGLSIASAERDAAGAVVLGWQPTGTRTRHHPGWLYGVALGLWRPGAALSPQDSWTAGDMPAPPTFDGPAALKDDAALEDWLIALRSFGLARLEGLPDTPGTVQRAAERIGTVRASNFGFLFTVETKPDPDSNAYTSAALTAHTDLASREVQPGLQFLHCLENTCADGFSTMVDGFAIAEALRDSEPEVFDALSRLPWVFSNRHADTDYRFSGPLIETGADGKITEIRNTGFLRAEPDMNDTDIPRAYAAVARFAERARDPAFVCRYPFRKGDMVAFDNRRILHGRDAFDPNGGTRRLQGCYMERDELFSRLRVLSRRRRARQGSFAPRQ
ncbi:MAG: TauD/TfdA family dioxygenase [Alphaproteobacteria bacterium]|nr:TauD/TfdA family dioxygenase [Alphaproteobacteria bacterium]